ncbi:MAG: hemolysin III family protein [Anaeroplasma sp.]
MFNEKEIKEIEKQNKKLNDKNKKIEERRLKNNIKNIRKNEQEEENRPKKEAKKKKKKYLRSLSNPPKRSVLEEIGNSITHGVGSILAVIALILLLLKSDTPLKVLASLVYGLCMFIMMLMSCLYHAFKYGSKVKFIWRRFDYSSIYLLIGGTFAPIYLIYWGNTLGIVLFIIQWVLIITGITFVCIFGPGRLRLLHYTMYFAIGWSGICFIPDFINNNLPLLWSILFGGVIYTLGMIPFAKKNCKSAHFIWHFFVLLGCAVQFIGIFLFIY